MSNDSSSASRPTSAGGRAPAFGVYGFVRGSIGSLELTRLIGLYKCPIRTGKTAKPEWSQATPAPSLQAEGEVDVPAAQRASRARPAGLRELHLQLSRRDSGSGEPESAHEAGASHAEHAGDGGVADDAHADE